MAPLGLVPVVKLNGKVITQPMDIMQALEEAFPDKNPLLAAEEKSTAEELFKLERGLVDAYFSSSKSSAGSSAVEDELGKVDAALQRSGGPYFLVKQFSLVDAVFAPFVERLVRGERWSPGGPGHGWQGVAWLQARSGMVAGSGVEQSVASLSAICISLP